MSVNSIQSKKSKSPIDNRSLSSLTGDDLSRNKRNSRVISFRDETHSVPLSPVTPKSAIGIGQGPNISHIMKDTVEISDHS